MSKRSDGRPPWKRKSPKKRSRPLSPGEKQEARTRASRAGRQYPNLVDNMAVARKKKTAKATGGTKKKARTTKAASTKTRGTKKKAATKETTSRKTRRNER